MKNAGPNPFGTFLEQIRVFFGIGYDPALVTCSTPLAKTRQFANNRRQ